MTINGGQRYGAGQIGKLLVKAGIGLQPLILGGGQARGLRSGTENVAAAIGLATALDIAQAWRPEEAARLHEIQIYFLKQLASLIPQAVVNGSQKKRLPNNVHITIPGVDNERLLMQLDEAGILAAAGSACSAGNEEPSHVLRAMGRSDNEARASLRFTMGRGTAKADIDRLIKALTSFHLKP